MSPIAGDHDRDQHARTRFAELCAQLDEMVAQLGGPRYYNRRGEQITYTQHLLSTPADVSVARTVLNGATVVTSCTQRDFGGNHPPLIFETLVQSDNPAQPDQIERYATEAAALAGHQRWVERARAEREVVDGPP
ncbi:hypothetical protein [Crossiella sp. CA198]|uniref:hypothetical protein n=1 Tax=Crossiella sp. CA198 TaxID=3455607 RepID=UPI003F8D45BE